MTLTFRLPRNEYNEIIDSYALAKVVEAACEAVVQGYLPTASLPKVGSRDLDITFNVTIDNPRIKELIDKYKRVGQQFSMRRILHYVVQNELLDDLMAQFGDNRQLKLSIIDRVNQYIKITADLVKMRPTLRSIVEPVTRALIDEVMREQEVSDDREQITDEETDYQS